MERLDVSGMVGESMTNQVPKPILFVTTTLGTGGAERMLLKVLQRLDRNRFEPVVVSLLDEGTTGRQIADLGIRVVCLRMDRLSRIAVALCAGSADPSTRFRPYTGLDVSRQSVGVGGQDARPQQGPAQFRDSPELVRLGARALQHPLGHQSQRMAFPLDPRLYVQ
jgi:hypothetical protein